MDPRCALFPPLQAYWRPHRPLAADVESLSNHTPPHACRRVITHQQLSCVERYITRIDELGPRYADTRVVYVSRNDLASLEGLAQFPRMQVLSATDNLLPDESVLQGLAHSAPELRVAAFERNPLAALPNYRARVLQALPQLEVCACGGRD